MAKKPDELRPDEAPDANPGNGGTHEQITQIGANVQDRLASMRHTNESGLAEVVHMAADPGLIESFKARHPEARTPSLSILADKLANIEQYFGETVQLNELALNRKFNAPQRQALVQGAEMVLTPETLHIAYEYFKSLYIDILELTRHFTTGDIRVFLDNTETFRLKPEPVQQLAVIVQRMQEAYPTIAQFLSEASPLMKRVVDERMGKIAAGGQASGVQPNFHVAARQNAGAVLTNIGDVIQGMKTYNPTNVANALASGLEVSLFTTTQHVGIPLGPTFAQTAGGVHVFEKHFPFKLDFLAMASECVLSLLPQLRALLDVLKRIDRYSNGLSKEQ